MKTPKSRKLKEFNRADPKGSKDKARGRIIQIYASLFLTGIVLGYWLGKRWSPPWDDPTSSPVHILEYVARANDPDQIKRFPVPPSPDRDLWRIELHPEQLHFVCGDRVFSYDARYNTLTEGSAVAQYTDVMLAAENARPKRRVDLYDGLFMFAGGLETYQISNTAPEFLSYIESASSVQAAAKRIGGGLLSLASGVGVGFVLGYENEPHCGNPLFQAQLRDKVFWKGVADLYKKQNTWNIFINHERREVSALMEDGVLFRRNPEGRKQALYAVIDASGERRLKGYKFWFDNE